MRNQLTLDTKILPSTAHATLDFGAVSQKMLGVGII